MVVPESTRPSNCAPRNGLLRSVSAAQAITYKLTHRVARSSMCLSISGVTCWVSVP